MTREHDRAAGRCVLGAHGFHQRRARAVEGGGRLVEHPQNGVVEEKPGERRAASLAGRKLAGEGVAFLFNTHALQRFLRTERRPAATHCLGEAQVLHRGKRVLECFAVSDEGDLAPPSGIARGFGYDPTPPADPARLGRQQPAHDAKRRRLSATVRPGDPQCVARPHHGRKPGKEEPVSAAAGQVFDAEQRGFGWWARHEARFYTAPGSNAAPAAARAGEAAAIRTAPAGAGGGPGRDRAGVKSGTGVGAGGGLLYHMRMDVSRPLELHREVVRPEYIDWNGHVNVAYYVLVFDHATDEFFDFIGLDEAYRKGRGYTTFTLECQVTYQREVLEGDPLRITTQLLDHDHKRAHYFHRMYHAEEGFLAATNELLSLHIDSRKRRSAPFPDDIMARWVEVHAGHADLPRPPEAGRPMGIRHHGPAETADSRVPSDA